MYGLCSSNEIGLQEMPLKDEALEKLFLIIENQAQLEAGRLDYWKERFQQGALSDSELGQFKFVVRTSRPFDVRYPDYFRTHPYDEMLELLVRAGGIITSGGRMMEEWELVELGISF